LITNDDGVEAAGLRAAAEAVMPIADVLIVAPKSPQTAMGCSFPRSSDQGIIEVSTRPLGHRSAPYYAVTGSPAQAVAHAILEIADRRPSLCVSGINNGENLGGTSLISGTVGAALEAACHDIPAVAVSVGPEDPRRAVYAYRRQEWAVASAVIRRLTAMILRDGLPPRVALLNVNIPATATAGTSVRVTVQSRQSHYICGAPGARDFARPLSLPIREQINADTLEPASDLYAFFVEQVISVTPMARDLTVHEAVGAALQTNLHSQWRDSAVARGRPRRIGGVDVSTDE
jgi:5'-nucleotidase